MTLSRFLLTAILAGAFQIPLAAWGEHTHQGIWWASPAGSENGWGLNITHQGNTLFATWFTYDTDGSPMWLVMSNGMRQMDTTYEGGYYGGGMMSYYNNTYQGDLYRTAGPAFNAAAFDPGAVVSTPVGTMSLNFDDMNSPSLTYTVNGVTQTKTLTRQVFANPVPECDDSMPGTSATPNYQDLWWRSPAGSEAGWGVNIIHQGNTIFATWFTYSPSGKGMWYVMANGERAADGSFGGALYSAHGPAFNSVPWDASKFGVIPVGTGKFTFSDHDNGVFDYTVDGITQSKPIMRTAYSSPVSNCRFP